MEKTKKEPRQKLRRGGAKPTNEQLEYIAFIRFLYYRNLDLNFSIRETMRLLKKYGLTMSQWTFTMIAKDVKNERLYKWKVLEGIADFYYNFADQNTEIYQEYEATKQPNQSVANP